MIFANNITCSLVVRKLVCHIHCNSFVFLKIYINSMWIKGDVFKMINIEGRVIIKKNHKWEIMEIIINVITSKWSLSLFTISRQCDKKAKVKTNNNHMGFTLKTTLVSTLFKCRHVFKKMETKTSKKSVKIQDKERA